MNETLVRQWAMLRQIPRHPRRVDASSIQSRLSDQGMGTSLRTVQRDLRKMASVFPLQCDESKPQGWSWREGASQLEIPSLDAHAALTFSLVELYLERLLPRATLTHLRPWFEAARGVSDAQASSVSKWTDKLRVVSRDPRMIAPRVDPEVQETIYDALLQERQVEIVYNAITAGTTKSYPVHPLALVVREQVVYLVAVARDYETPRNLALHRIRSARILEGAAKKPKEFDIDRYLARDLLSLQVGPQPLKLVMEVRHLVGEYLRETPIAEKQSITELGNGWDVIEAVVADTIQLRSWLRSLGSDANVLEPPGLREEMKTQLQELVSLYGDEPSARN